MEELDNAIRAQFDAIEARFKRECAEALARGETCCRGYLIGPGVDQPFFTPAHEGEIADAMARAFGVQQ